MYWLPFYGKEPHEVRSRVKSGQFPTAVSHRAQHNTWDTTVPGFFCHSVSFHSTRTLINELKAIALITLPAVRLTKSIKGGQGSLPTTHRAAAISDSPAPALHSHYCPQPTGFHEYRPAWKSSVQRLRGSVRSRRDRGARSEPSPNSQRATHTQSVNFGRAALQCCSGCSISEIGIPPARAVLMWAECIAWLLLAGSPEARISVVHSFRKHTITVLKEHRVYKNHTVNASCQARFPEQP